MYWCISWIIKCLSVTDARCKREDYIGSTFIKRTKIFCRILCKYFITNERVSVPYVSRKLAVAEKKSRNVNEKKMLLKVMIVRNST